MGAIRRVAMVAMQGSPVAAPGRGESGSMSVAIRATAIELARLGVEVEILTRATDAPSVTELAPGVTVHELLVGDSTDEFGEAVAVLAGRDSPRYDVIHAHFWRSGIAALPVALELGIPLVQTFHSLAAMTNRRLAKGETPEPEIRVRSEMYLANQADALIAASSAEVAALIDSVHAPAGRIWVVPPGVDTELFTPARAISESHVRTRLGIDPERPIIVVAGRVQPLKGQDLAIAAVVAARAENPVLVVAGEPTPGAERWAADLRDLTADDSVRFAGALDRESLADLYAAASLTLVPSHTETFGLVALESAASGTPVIASAAVGLTGAVAAGISGVLLGSRDPQEWGTAITALLDDRMLLAELAASARSHALEFSWATSAAGLLGIYASLR